MDSQVDLSECIQNCVGVLASKHHGLDRQSSLGK